MHVTKPALYSGEDVGLENSNNFEGNVKHRIEIGPEIDVGPARIIMLAELTLKRAARASAREYCPVSPDYNPSDYVRKSEIDLQNQCPKLQT